MTRKRVFTSALAAVVVAVGVAVASAGSVGREADAAVAAEGSAPAGATTATTRPGGRSAVAGTANLGGVLCAYEVTNPRVNPNLSWVEAAGTVACDAPVQAISIYVTIYAVRNGVQTLFTWSPDDLAVAVGQSSHSSYAAGACQSAPQYIAEAYIIIDAFGGVRIFEQRVPSDLVGLFC